MHKVILALADDRKFFPLKPRFARNIITGLCRIDGWSVGVVASNSMFLGGVLDVAASDKAARFIALCDAFRIPLLFLQDVPGFLVGTKAEQRGSSATAPGCCSWCPTPRCPSSPWWCARASAPATT